MVWSAHSSISLLKQNKQNLFFPLKVQCSLFFCLTSPDYICTERDRGAAAGVCLGLFHGSVNVHFKLSF